MALVEVWRAQGGLHGKGDGKDLGTARLIRRSSEIDCASGCFSCGLERDLWLRD